MPDKKGNHSFDEFRHFLRCGAKVHEWPKKPDGDAWVASLIGNESFDGEDELMAWIVRVSLSPESNAFFQNCDERYRRADRQFGFILIDIVGYSKRSQEHQIAVIYRFQDLLLSGVTSNESHIKDALDGFVPTGDGCYVIIKPESIPSTLDIAEFILTRIQEYNEERVSPLPIETRFAVHVGEADYIRDLSERWNYLGNGMNDVGRICGLIPSGDVDCIYISEEAKRRIVSNGNQYGKLRSELDKHGKEHQFRRLLRRDESDFQ